MLESWIGLGHKTPAHPFYGTLLRFITHMFCVGFCPSFKTLYFQFFLEKQLNSYLTRQQSTMHFSTVEDGFMKYYSFLYLPLQLVKFKCYLQFSSQIYKVIYSFSVFNLFFSGDPNWLPKSNRNIKFAMNTQGSIYQAICLVLFLFLPFPFPNQETSNASLYTLHPVMQSKSTNTSLVLEIGCW